MDAAAQVPARPSAPPGLPAIHRVRRAAAPRSLRQVVRKDRQRSGAKLRVGLQAGHSSPPGRAEGEAESLRKVITAIGVSDRCAEPQAVKPLRQMRPKRGTRTTRPPSVNKAARRSLAGRQQTSELATVRTEPVNRWNLCAATHSRSQPRRAPLLGARWMHRESSPRVVGGAVARYDARDR